MECQVLIKHTSAKITRVRLGLCVQSVVCSECRADKLRGDCTTCCTTTTSPPTFLNTTPNTTACARQNRHWRNKQVKCMSRDNHYCTQRHKSGRVLQVLEVTSSASACITIQRSLADSQKIEWIWSHNADHNRFNYWYPMFGDNLEFSLLKMIKE